MNITASTSPSTAELAALAATATQNDPRWTSVIARDPAVTRQIDGWDWQDGLRPAPDAPVWRIDTFRDRFLTAFGG